MHHWTDLAESFLKMYGFAMLRTAGQKLYQVYHCVHYFVLFIIWYSYLSATVPVTVGRLFQKHLYCKSYCTSCYVYIVW